jgi:hypothetical protein
MPQPFDTTNITENVTGLIDLFEYGNEVTSPAGAHYFGDIMVAVVWIVVWGLFANYYTERPQIKAMIVSSFATFFFAVGMDLIGLVDRLMLALPFAGLLLSIVADKVMDDI